MQSGKSRVLSASNCADIGPNTWDFDDELREVVHTNSSLFKDFPNSTWITSNSSISTSSSNSKPIKFYKIWQKLRVKGNLSPSLIILLFSCIWLSKQICHVEVCCASLMRNRHKENSLVGDISLKGEHWHVLSRVLQWKPTNEQGKSGRIDMSRSNEVGKYLPIGKNR